MHIYVKKDSDAGEFCEFIKNTYFEEHLRTAAPDDLCLHRIFFQIFGVTINRK